MTIPIILNAILLIPAFTPIVGDNSVWLSFFGSLIGALSNTPALRAWFVTIRSLRSIAISWATLGMYFPVLLLLRMYSRCMVEAARFFGHGRPAASAASFFYPVNLVCDGLICVAILAHGRNYVPLR